MNRSHTDVQRDEPEVVSFGPFEFDGRGLLLSRSGEALSVTPKALEVLRCLLDRPGKVVLKEELLDRVWQDAAVTENSLVEAVRALRQALGDNARAPAYIETAHRRGYRFIGTVRGAPEDAAGSGGNSVVGGTTPSASVTLSDSAASPVPVGASRSSGPSIFARPGARALLLLVAGIVAGAYYASPIGGRDGEPTGEQPLRASLTLPEDAPMQIQSDLRNMAISPNGERVLYQGPLTTSGMYVRDLDSDDFVYIEGSEGFQTATFSPDGSQVAFFAPERESVYNPTTGQARRSRLVKAPVAGGPPVVLAQAIGYPSGLSWGPDGTIVYATGAQRGLWVLPPDPGAAPTLIAAEHDHFYLWPHFLPGGNAVLVNAGKWEMDKKFIAAISLDSGEERILADFEERAGMARFVDSGHLVVGRDGQLFAAPFDPEALETIGELRPVLEDVSFWAGPDTVLFDVSRNGELLYVSSEFPLGIGELQLVSRDGESEPLPVRLYDEYVSRDGKTIIGKRGRDLYTHTIGRKTSMKRLTFDQLRIRNPLFTPEGQRVVFSASPGRAYDPPNGAYDLYWMPVAGGEPLLLHDGTFDVDPESWSPDGRLLALTETHPVSSEDIWLLPLGGDPVPFLQTPATESGASFSPDGRWIAYHSDESGRFEIYLRRAPEDLAAHDPGPGGYKVQVTDDCGGWPTWSFDGGELYFRSCELGLESFRAVSVQTDPEISIGEPELLFEGKYARQRPGPSYSITPDGRFLLRDRSATAPRLQLIHNWDEELRRLVPLRR